MKTEKQLDAYAVLCQKSSNPDLVNIEGKLVGNSDTGTIFLFINKINNGMAMHHCTEEDEFTFLPAHVIPETIRAYVPHPKQVHAIKYTNESLKDILMWAKKDVSVKDDSSILFVSTSQGVAEMHLGDYLVRNEVDFYPCSAQVFEAKYREFP